MTRTRDWEERRLGRNKWSESWREGETRTVKDRATEKKQRCGGRQTERERQKKASEVLERNGMS